jgi:hypothetical protein
MNASGQSPLEQSGQCVPSQQQIPNACEAFFLNRPPKAVQLMKKEEGLVSIGPGEKLSRSG